MLLHSTDERLAICGCRSPNRLEVGPRASELYVGVDFAFTCFVEMKIRLVIQMEVRAIQVTAGYVDQRIHVLKSLDKFPMGHATSGVRPRPRRKFRTRPRPTMPVIVIAGPRHRSIIDPRGSGRYRDSCDHRR